MGLFSKPKATHYEIDGKKLVCQFCQHDTFYKRTQKLAGTFNWTDNTICFICTNCKFMHWFFK